MIFSEKHTVESYLCDRSDHLQLWGAARLMQEVAEHHTTVTHIGFHDLMSQGKAWVLCRMYYRINQMPQVDEHIILNTWSRGTDTVFALREYTITDEKGNVYVAASSSWALIDFDKRKACRLSNLMDNYEHHPQFATEKQTLKRIPINKDATRNTLATFQVQNSMLDHTNHVNNAEYVKWVIDQIPEEVVWNKIKGFEIDYISETKAKDTVTVDQYVTEESIFQINNTNGLSALIRITY